MVVMAVGEQCRVKRGCSGDLLMKPIKESLDRNILNIFKGKTKLLLSELKESDAAVLGASALGWEARQTPPPASTQPVL